VVRPQREDRLVGAVVMRVNITEHEQMDQIGAPESKTIAQSHRWTRQTLRETYWWAYSPEVQQRLRKAIARVARREASRDDAQVYAAEGHLIDVDLSLQPVRDPTGQDVFLVPPTTVITERKRTENALRESNEKFQVLADKITDAFWIRSKAFLRIFCIKKFT
jgi:PAS domain-containing protein